MHGLQRLPFLRTQTVTHVEVSRRRNAGASLVDLGDGVLCLEFHSKLNAIGGDTIQMLHAGIKEASTNFAALVVGNDAPDFSAGANLMMIVMPLLLLGLTDDTSKAAQLLGSRPMLWLGRLSYALYMSHAVTERLLEWTLPVAAFTQAGLAVRLGVLLVYWAMLFAGSWLLYQTVEEPGRAWLRSFGRSR